MWSLKVTPPSTPVTKPDYNRRDNKRQWDQIMTTKKPVVNKKARKSNRNKRKENNTTRQKRTRMNDWKKLDEQVKINQIIKLKEDKWRNKGLHENLVIQKSKDLRQNITKKKMLKSIRVSDSVTFLNMNIQGGWQEKSLLLAIDGKAEGADIITIQESHLFAEYAAISSDYSLTDKYKIFHNSLNKDEVIKKWEARKLRQRKNDDPDLVKADIEAAKNTKRTWKPSEGMVIMVKKHLLKKFNIIPLSERNSRIQIASLGLENNSIMLIVNIYAPVELNDNKKFWPKLKKEINLAMSKFKGQAVTKIIMGDFNTTLCRGDHVSYTMGPNFVNREVKECLELTESCQVTDIIKKYYGKEKVYTREVMDDDVKSHNEFKSQSRIDHILISNSKTHTVSSCGILKNMTTYSDHYGIKMTVKVNPSVTKKEVIQKDVDNIPRLNTRVGKSHSEITERLRDKLSEAHLDSIAEINELLEGNLPYT